MDKAGQDKTASGSISLVKKVDSGKSGHIKTLKNNGLVPLLGTMFFS